MEKLTNMAKSYVYIAMLILLLILLLPGCQPENQQAQPVIKKSTGVQTIPAKVTWIVDGDTIHVQLPGKRQEKVRFTGIDTPELLDEPDGQLAAEYTRKKLAGRTVYLELDVGQRDKYGRLLAYLWLEQPDDDAEAEVRAKMFNAHLLLHGYARIMTVPPNVNYAELFNRLEQEARETGLHATQNSI